MEKDGRFLFGSEIKALFAYPGVKAVIGKYGLCEIFGLGPARSPGCGVFLGVHEIPPAHCALLDYSGLKLWRYWDMEAKEHTESYAETVEHVRELLFDAIRRQLISDVPICTLLSGGLDSSIVSAVAADYFKKQGKQLDTYSFDYTDNDINFKASKFQPAQDRPFVDKMVEHIGSNHHYLTCNYDELYEKLFDAVRAKDLPGMADVDSSMLFFAGKIKENHTVCLSGECADEIFGGYPWFRDEEALRNPVFPWSKNLELRQMVLRPEIAGKLYLEEYVTAQYEKTMQRTKCLAKERDGFGKTAVSPEEYWEYLKKTQVSDIRPGTESLRRRQLSRLNQDWFMVTLLDRKDRMTMANGLEIRVPFADHRIMEYVYNIPWEYKCKDGRVKSLLLDAAADILPREVLERKKCPYPKTYDPKYEKLLKGKLSEILEDKNEPLNELLNGRVLKQMMDSPSDYGSPWFGQLMAQPQMFAYFIEINYWMKEYRVEVRV
jgi:asparagine synthase (glutamine-hydrolysing)